MVILYDLLTFHNETHFTMIGFFEFFVFCHLTMKVTGKRHECFEKFSNKLLELE